MRYRLLLFLTLSSLLLSCQPERLRRDQSFLGIHFDFHAGPKDTLVGANTTPEMVQAIIDRVHPDYLQIDCKGHPGYSSYPTQVGNPAPGLVCDPLAVWREVTARNGVALYLHYSGVWDARAVELHPDWAVRNAVDTASTKFTSVFGPYVDSLLIPQLKELAGTYKADGVWVDGECWATLPDWSERAVRLFREQTGADAPRSPQDTLWHEWKQFHREAFRNYLRHYTDAVHEAYPDFQICSNWSFTSHMPEPVSAHVDFLSGDYRLENSVNSARIAARYLSLQGLPWDLMAWGFVRGENNTRPLKSPVQLCREAAVTLSQGGGFEAYYTQNRDGSLDLGKLPPMAAAAAFARERQAFCHHSVSVPQVAVLLSTYDFQHYADPKAPSTLFPTPPAAVGGILNCLLECQCSVDVLGEASLQPDPDRFPLIVIPECETLDPKFCDDLVEYARRGGSLLVVGKTMAEFFSEGSGVELAGERWFTEGLGAGRMGFIPMEIAEAYESGETAAEIRREMKRLVDELFPEPMVEVRSSPWVDLSVRRHKHRLQIHLVNTSGDHRHAPVIDTVPPVRDIDVSVRLPRKPRKIVRQPDGQSMPFSYTDGKACFRVDSLDIYDIIEIVH